MTSFTLHCFIKPNGYLKQKPARYNSVCYFRPTLDLEDLNRALKAGEDISAIKEICTGKIIPVEGMPELWKVCQVSS